MGRSRLNPLLLSLAVSACAVSVERTTSRQPSLERLWSRYKSNYLHADGYILDRLRNRGEVTSEGQAYALLQSVWMDDEETFRRVFEWTEDRLARSDGLYAWRWSPADGGRVLDPNTAADADQEAAWALILAAVRWDRPAYRERAQALLSAVRDIEGLVVEGGWFPSAGNWAVTERIVNLSYFLPYAYPYFARVDPGGDWDGVLERGYQILRQTLARPDTRLIPDFMVLDELGTVRALPAENALSGDFSHDAMRIYWRVAFDCRLYRRPEACADAAQAGFVLELLARDGRLGSRYTTSGRVLDQRECLCFYAMVLPALEMLAPEAAVRVGENHLYPSRLRRVMRRRDRYYDANWIWFGQALSQGFLLQATPPLESLADP